MSADLKTPAQQNQGPSLETVDLTDPAVMECPYAAYALLREQAPIHRTANGKFVVTKYADVERGLADHKNFSRDTSGYHDPTRTYQDFWKNPKAREIFQKEGWDRCWPHGNVINSDPPFHTKYRKLMNPMFTQARVEQAGPFIRGLVNELIDSFIDEGEIEFVERFAVPLPMQMICGLLGFPREDLEQLKAWSMDMAQSLSGLNSLDEEVRLARSMVAFQHYIVGQLEEKRRHPKDDIISHLAQVPLVPEERKDEGYTLSDLISLTFSMHIGGNESTTNSLTSALWLACTHPEAMAEMHEDPSLIPKFIEESLRLETPFQTFTRAVRGDVEFCGVQLRKNDKLDLRLGAANRDSTKFDDPDILDLHRPSPAHHLAFSIGVHHCLGANLARFEMLIAFQELFGRLKNIRLVPGKNDFTHIPHLMFRGFKTLHIAFDKPPSAPASPR